MHHVLIDTNIWINLIQGEGKDRLIPSIKLVELILEFIEKGNIKILVPELIIKEWQDNFIKADQRVRKLRDNNLVDERSKLLQSSIINAESASKENLVSKISTLLDSAKIKNSTSSEILERRNKKKAPFHKKDSINDAIIYFSAIEYLESQGVDKLFFISENHNDFGAPDNPNILHSELEVDGIEVFYFRQLTSFIKQVLGGGDLEEIFKKEEGHYYISICYDQSIKKEPILEQLYLTLEYYGSKTGFIPKQLLFLLYPFKLIDRDSYTECELNKLVINNQELYSALKNLDEQKSIVDDLDSKINTIYKWLRSSGIEEIMMYDNRSETLSISVDEECDCLQCLYYKLEYDKLIETLPRDIDDTRDVHGNMMYAFIHYELRNYDIAFVFLKKVYQKSIEDSNYLLKYIAAYSLIRLADAVKYSKHFKFHIISYVKSISISNIFFENLASGDEYNRRYISWLDDGYYYGSYALKVHESLRDLSLNYYSSLRGGYFTNKNIDKLFYSFYDYIDFVWKNKLLTSHYSNTYSLYEKVLEGYLISSQLKDSTRNYLHALNDYMIFQVIHFASPDNFLKLLLRYRIKEIHYNRGLLTSYSFPELLIRHMRFYGKRSKYLGEIYPQNNEWKLRCYRQLHNALILCSVLDISEAEFNDIFTNLIEFIKTQKNESNGFRQYFHAIPNLLYKKGHLIKPSLFTKFINLIITDKAFHSEDIITATTDIMSKNNKLSIKKKSTIQKKILKCFVHSDDVNVFNMGCYWYAYLDDDFKAEMKKVVTNKLNEKFSNDIYYVYSVYGIIDFTEFINVYLSSIQLRLYNSIFTDNELNKNYLLSDAINLAFKYNLDTSKEPFDRFRGLSDYYDWLLDMDVFNYEKFNPRWILEYGTIYYHQKIFNHPKVVDVLRVYFKTHHKPLARIQSLFLIHNEV